MNNFIDFVKRLLKVEFIIPISIICITIIVILRIIIKSGKNLRTKIFSFGNDNGEKKNNIRYLYIIEKMERINNKIYKLKQELNKKQDVIQIMAFLEIKSKILDIYERDLKNYIDENDVLIPGCKDIRNTKEFLFYKILINDITEENMKRLYDRIVDDEYIANLSPEKFNEYKKQQSKYYRQSSVEIFKTRYDVNDCIIPLEEHLENGVKKGDEEIARIIDNTQNMLRNNAVETFEKINMYQEEIERLKSFLYKNEDKINSNIDI